MLTIASWQKKYLDFVCVLIAVVGLFFCLPESGLADPVKVSRTSHEYGWSRNPCPERQRKRSKISVPKVEYTFTWSCHPEKNSGETLPAEFAPLVFQAFTVGQNGDIQKASNNIANASLGRVSHAYRGLHHWWKDDLVGNLFQSIVHLVEKWLSDLIDGSLADTAQQLARWFAGLYSHSTNLTVSSGMLNLRIVAIVRRCCNFFYGLAIALWILSTAQVLKKEAGTAKVWLDFHHEGQFLRFSCITWLLFTWPTVTAFIKQNFEVITSSMNCPDQLLVLDDALAQAVKASVIAAGAGATSIFAPLLANLAIPVSGYFVGQLFYFLSTITFAFLCGVLILELACLLRLKGIEIAIVTAQYVLAPVFLVLLMTRETEQKGINYAKSLIETSLWTITWAGLLKVLTVILLSTFTPWAKILITIAVLQLMIQVPCLMRKSRMSPAVAMLSAVIDTESLLDTPRRLLKSLATFYAKVRRAMNCSGPKLSWFDDSI
jgi:hypothetical protein